jgi:hypothetical protein
MEKEDLDGDFFWYFLIGVGNEGKMRCNFRKEIYVGLREF